MRHALLHVLSVALLLAASSSLTSHGAPGGAATEEAGTTLAVIVNPKNPTTNLSLDQLRSYFKLDRKAWPHKRSCEVFLRPSKSAEMAVLLEHVYRMSSTELRKFWVGKIFRGEISAKPSVVPTAKAAHARVLKVPGAVTVVRADEVGEGVRVLAVDGKRPGDRGYPLVTRKGAEPGP